MATKEKSPAAEQVPCEVCLKEIPKSEATVAEAAEYVLYFCGLECYAKWKAGNGKPEQPGDTIAP